MAKFISEASPRARRDPAPVRENLSSQSLRPSPSLNGAASRVPLQRESQRGHAVEKPAAALARRHSPSASFSPERRRKRARRSPSDSLSEVSSSGSRKKSKKKVKKKQHKHKKRSRKEEKKRKAEKELKARAAAAAVAVSKEGALKEEVEEEEDERQSLVSAGFLLLPQTQSPTLEQARRLSPNAGGGVASLQEACRNTNFHRAFGLGCGAFELVSEHEGFLPVQGGSGGLRRREADSLAPPPLIVAPPQEQTAPSRDVRVNPKTHPHLYWECWKCGAPNFKNRIQCHRCNRLYQK